MNFNYLLILYILSLFIQANCFSQNKNAQDGYVLGKSDLIYNGRLYYKEYPNASGNPYFGENVWDTSWISIEGILFSGEEIKLDIVSDKLILNPDNSIAIELTPQLIDSFKIFNSVFIGVESMGLSKKYVEKVYSGKLFFYKVHQKEFIKEYNSYTPHGKISEISTTYYLLKEGVEIKVNSKRDFIKVFTNNKKEIKSFLKESKTKYRKATNNELNKLMDYCENL